uniref:Uncharacterized protein n=1 Tax=Tetranychus urticae TaxID=32264 RepID=T1KYA0_TETUR
MSLLWLIYDDDLDGDDDEYIAAIVAVVVAADVAAVAVAGDLNGLDDRLVDLSLERQFWLLEDIVTPKE